MHLTRMTTAVIATLLTVGCGYTIKTSTDYNHAVNFSNYHTFFMMKGNSSGNPLLDQRASDDDMAPLALDRPGVGATCVRRIGRGRARWPGRSPV